MENKENVIELKKAITYDGTEYTSLTLDFENLSGKDLLDAERESAMFGKDVTPVQEFNKGYLSVVAAKAADVPTDLMMMLGVKDFTAITLKTQDFLLQ